MVSAVSVDDRPANKPLPPPDEHMQEMTWFIGNWRIRSRMLQDDGSWREEQQRAEHTFELNGHLIFEHFFGPLDGEPFEAWSLRKYNQNSGKWDQRWVSTHKGGFLNWSGSYAEGQYVGYSVESLDENGNVKVGRAVREVFDTIKPESFAWRLETSADGGQSWKVIWTLDYTREK
jgi:hypothetical protein